MNEIFGGLLANLYLCTAFNRKRISLDYGVMVAQQVLVLFVQVRILVVQQSSSLEDTKPRKSKCFAGFFVAFSEFFTTDYTDSHRLNLMY